MSLRSLIFLGTLVVAYDLNAQGFQPDHTKASIDGVLALMEIPVTRSEVGIGPVDPSGCVVVLAPAEALDQRLTYPCSEWYVPPTRGAYVLWLEQKGQVSTSQILLQYVAEKFKGQGFIGTHDMVSTGYVASANAIPAGHTLRYQHLDRPGRGFQLRVAAGKERDISRMPPGRVMVGLYGPDDNAVALSKPFEVIAGETSSVSLTPPAAGSDLLVIVEKPRQQKGGGRIVAMVNGEEMAADVLHETTGRYYAWWFGLDAKSATVRLDSDSFSLKPAEVSLRSGRVSTFRGSVELGTASAKSATGPTEVARHID